MEEKERYELTDTDCILDTERNIVVSDVFDVITNADIITDLLNQQDKRIKELEEELDDAKRDYIPKLEFGLQRANKMGRDAEKEIQQLKQQLKDTEESYNNTMRYLNKTRSELLNLPKKIVEYFYDEIRHRAILEDDYCPDHNLERKYGVRKCLLEDIRTTILKKYGGEK